MSPKLKRRELPDGSFIEVQIDIIEPDIWRPHGYKYRMAWVQDQVCRVLFDNHTGKVDHMHLDGEEAPYVFINIHQVIADFLIEVKKRGGLK